MKRITIEQIDGILKEEMDFSAAVQAAAQTYLGFILRVTPSLSEIDCFCAGFRLGRQSTESEETAKEATELAIKAGFLPKEAQ